MQEQKRVPFWNDNKRLPWVVSLLTVYVLMVHGYHPYAEDGGLYVAGIKKLLEPELYPQWTEFVTEHLRFSVFAPVMAGLVRGTHLPLEWVLLGVYLGSVWATLFAGGWCCGGCVRAPSGRWAAWRCWLAGSRCPLRGLP